MVLPRIDIDRVFRGTAGRQLQLVRGLRRVVGLRRAKKRLLHHIRRVAREIEHRHKCRDEEGTAGTQVWSSVVAGRGVVAAHTERHWGHIHQISIKPSIPCFVRLLQPLVR